uniref:AAA family ATPase n=1 Tax=Slackia isoflavoniconvertens TaxID=572010 RepID=UPI003AF1AEB9
TLEDIRRLSDEERSEAKAWYDAQLRDRENGQAAFTTFHQSYGYEEFIEGIRPVIPEEDDSGVEGDLGYTYEDGVFKAFCKRASKPIAIDKTKHFGFNEDPTVWKVSLGGTGDNPVRRECLENDHIRIGWDSYGPDVTDETDFSINGGKTVLTAFATKMRIGDIVLSCYSATTVDAIGVVIGEVEWRDERDHFKRQRDVKWIAKGIAFDIVEEFGLPTMTLSTVYRLKLDEADVLKIIEQTGGEDLRMTVPNDKPYIFIIDEINRGNISKVFGELITLIEPSKRAGQPGQQSAILPYTKQPFSVPANVTIIGTMNTADRSIALMDTALRRRFRFVEMMPDYEALDGIGEVDGVDVSKMVRRINQRIDVLYDREHEIGHAYFMELKDDPTIGKLSAIFEERVIPLLQEYFYDNYEKICLVLGDNQKTGDMPRFFAEDKTVTAEELFGDSDVSYEDVHDYRLNSGALADPQVYIGVYEQA